jgi:hypothetical protein
VASNVWCPAAGAKPPPKEPFAQVGLFGDRAGMSAPLDPVSDLVMRLLAIIEALCAALAEQAAGEGMRAHLATKMTAGLRRMADDIAAAAPGRAAAAEARRPLARRPLPSSSRMQRSTPLRWGNARQHVVDARLREHDDKARVLLFGA